ncbi:MAG: hypothetical protein QOG17_1201, partial [Gammaproteobacteria bacterium]|nr:hypothetical protein [Gammaproteobacteria bacterium]
MSLSPPATRHRWAAVLSRPRSPLNYLF